MFIVILLFALNSPPYFKVLQSNSGRVDFEVNFNSYELKQRNGRTILSIEGAGIDESGLPIFGTLLNVPNLKDIEIEIVPEDVDTLDVELSPEVADIPPYTLSPPMIFRDIRVRTLGVRPFKYDYYNKKLFLYKKLKVKAVFKGVDTRNSKKFKNKISYDFVPLYCSMVLNFDRTLYQTERGGYLIVVPDELVDEVEPLAEWKSLLGYKTQIIKLSDIGSNPTEQDIKDYIAQIYFSEDPPPEYLLLFGDTDMPIGSGIPTFRYSGDADDLQYGLMEGDDYLPEIIVGRISVENEMEASLVVAKTLGYEKNPYTGDTEWFKRALMVAGVYPSPEGEIVNTTKLTKLWIREKMVDYGFLGVDTIFYYFPNQGGTTEDVINSINNGVCFVNYRGWSNTQGWHYPPFYLPNIEELQNGWKLPVMFSMTCGTGDFASSQDPSFGEAWMRAGIPGSLPQPKGGVAFMGPSNIHTHTRWNNAIDVGIFEGILGEGIWHFGVAGIRGLMELLKGFPDRTSPEDSSGVAFSFHVYCMQGDPSLLLWTDIPESLEVIKPSYIPIGNVGVNIRVKDSQGEPVGEAYVNLYKEDEIYVGKVTDSLGYAFFNIEPAASGTLYVTVSGKNFIPYTVGIPVYESGLYVGIENVEVQDAVTGNGDGKLNPAETVELAVTLKNYGNSITAHNVNAVLTTDDPSITVIDSLVSYGDISPGSSASGDGNFILSVRPDCPDRKTVTLDIKVESGDSIWTSYIEKEIYGSKISIKGILVNDEDGNGYIEPGESGEIILTIKNTGRITADNLSGVLRSRYTGALVTDSIAPFGSLNPGDTVKGAPFSVYVVPDAAFGRKISFEIKFTSSDGSVRKSIFRITLGPEGPNVPGGPDAYGYWAYDIADTLYDEVPQYNWIEIDPNYGGDGTLLLSNNDEIATLMLPFPFKYYGNIYGMVTVSSNGWIAFDTTDQFSPRNWPIPSPFGPSNLVAVFWDDLDPGDSGGVYYKYDSANNRLIIEWSRILNRYDYTSLETFEVILLDPSHYSSATGDGELIFQYLEINNVDSTHYFSTVGIENEDHSTGIQYVYGNFYDPTSLTLQNGLAIKFTTDPPDTYTVRVKEKYSEKEDSKFFNLSVGPNPAQGKVKIKLSIVKKGTYSISIYDVSGRFIKKLYDGELTPGNYIFNWDGDSEKGKRVGRGIYFLLLDGNLRKTKKVVLLK